MFPPPPPPAVPLTVAYGDGVGPEILEAALNVMREAGAMLNIETIEVGSKHYNIGALPGYLPAALVPLKRTKLLLKGPTVPPPDQEGFEDVTASLLRMFDLSDANKDTCTFNDHRVAVYSSEHFTLFEPEVELQLDNAGKDNADPSAMLFACVLLLGHIGQHDTAALVRNAWLAALEDGVTVAVGGTIAFAEAIVERLGRKPASASAHA